MQIDFGAKKTMRLLLVSTLLSALLLATGLWVQTTSLEVTQVRLYNKAVREMAAGDDGHAIDLFYESLTAFNNFRSQPAWLRLLRGEGQLSSEVAARAHFQLGARQAVYGSGAEYEFGQVLDLVPGILDKPADKKTQARLEELRDKAQYNIELIARNGQPLQLKKKPKEPGQGSNSLPGKGIPGPSKGGI